MGVYISNYFLDLSKEQLLGIIISNFQLRSIENESCISEVIEGVMIESNIRKFITSHSSFTRSIKRLKNRNARYGEESMYLFYDHMMANKIKLINKDYFIDLTQRIKFILKENKIILSNNSRRVANRIIKYRIIDRFDRIDGIHQLMICQQKYNLCSSMSLASVEDLINQYEFINSDFEEMLISLREKIENKMAINSFITSR